MKRTIQRVLLRAGYGLGILLAVGLVLGSGEVLAAGSPPITEEWVDKWSRDLDYLEEQLPAMHPDAFHSSSEDEFAAALENLRVSLPALSHQQILTQLTVIVASLQDGHTRLTLPLPPESGFTQGHTQTPQPNAPELLCHLLPVRFILLQDGLFIAKIESGEDWAVGARVLRIGSLETQEAIAAVAPTIRRDNEFQLENLLPMHLVIPEILHARGVIDDPGEVTLVLSPAPGKERTLVLEPVIHRSVVWVPSSKRKGLPLYQQHQDENYWFEYLAAERVVYLRYREVQNTGDENIGEFALRLEKFLAGNQVDGLIVDLRGNSGGNNYLNQPLLHAIIRASRVNRPGRLFTVIDRGTFSAAMMFAVDMESHTRTVFVGESTGGKPNHYGDSRKIQLPSTGLTVRVSSLYWQYSSPRDERSWIAPEIAVPVASAEYFADRDPVLEEILSIVGSPEEVPDADFEGDWRGVLSARSEKVELVLHLRRAGEKWKALLDLPEQEVEGIELQAVFVERGHLRFMLEGQDGLLQFTGALRGAWIMGQVEQDGALSVLAAKKVENPE